MTYVFASCLSDRCRRITRTVIELEKSLRSTWTHTTRSSRGVQLIVGIRLCQEASAVFALAMCEKYKFTLYVIKSITEREKENDGLERESNI